MGFTSTFKPLAHGTLNWDTQLNTDLGALEAAMNGATDVGPGRDMNGISLPGMYIGNGWANAPDSSGYTFLLTVLNASTDGNQVAQMAHRLGGAGDNLWWFRTRVGAVWGAWILLNRPSAQTGTGNIAAGWSGVRSNMVRVGSIVHFEFSATRNGGTITSGPTGDITNVQIGDVGDWIPDMAWAPLAVGAGGPLASFAADGSGKLWICALPPSYSLTNGQEITCGGSWVTSAP